MPSKDKVVLLKETTKWDTPVPNHTYLIQNHKAIGYIKVSDGKCYMFKKPMFFDKKNRTFEIVQTYQ